MLFFCFSISQKIITIAIRLTFLTKLKCRFIACLHYKLG